MNLWTRSTWLSAPLRKSMYKGSMFLHSNLMGLSSPKRAYNYKRSSKPQVPIAITSLKQILTLACTLIFLSGCLNSKSEQRETITLRLDTPSAGWKLAPLEAWETDKTILCLFQLTPPEGMSAQVITSIASEMQLSPSKKPKTRVVLGKTWKWSSESDIQFPNSYEAFKKQLGKAARSVELLTPEH